MNDSSNADREDTRTTTINLEAFSTLKKNRGWTDQQIEARSGVSVRLLGRLRQGLPVRLKSVKALANSFGVPLETLIHGIEPAIVPAPSKLVRHHQIEVRLDVDFVEMDAARQSATKKLIEKVIGSNAEIDILGVRDGSTILSLKMVQSDVLRLLAAMVDEELDSLRIVRIHVKDYTWLMAILGMLEFNDGKIRTFDDKTFSDLVWNRQFNYLLKIKTQNCHFCKAME